uniref:F-box domain-containing protein n=1 Tax=Rhabditophanes sp. KR3021 TaxID=114890 RepID=A0AC35TPY6_9BILA
MDHSNKKDSVELAADQEGISLTGIGCFSDLADRRDEYKRVVNGCIIDTLEPNFILNDQYELHIQGDGDGGLLCGKPFFSVEDYTRILDAYTSDYMKNVRFFNINIYYINEPTSLQTNLKINYILQLLVQKLSTLTEVNFIFDKTTTNPTLFANNLLNYLDFFYSHNITRISVECYDIGLVGHLMKMPLLIEAKAREVFPNIETFKMIIPTDTNSKIEEHWALLKELEDMDLHFLSVDVRIVKTGTESIATRYLAILDAKQNTEPTSVYITNKDFGSLQKWKNIPQLNKTQIHFDASFGTFVQNMINFEDVSLFKYIRSLKLKIETNDDCKIASALPNKLHLLSILASFTLSFKVKPNVTLCNVRVLIYMISYLPENLKVLRILESPFTWGDARHIHTRFKDLSELELTYLDSNLYKQHEIGYFNKFENLKLLTLTCAGQKHFVFGKSLRTLTFMCRSDPPFPIEPICGEVDDSIDQLNSFKVRFNVIDKQPLPRLENKDCSCHEIKKPFRHIARRLDIRQTLHCINLSEISDWNLFLHNFADHWREKDFNGNAY